MSARTRATVLALVACAGMPAAASAQTPSLPRVDSLITLGDYDGARTTLDNWWETRGRGGGQGAEMPRALTLRARLQPDPKDAEADYLAVVLGYPASPFAADALLRLGQGLLATGDATRAAAYLDRLTTDYPGYGQRPVSLLWLARAQNAARRSAAACSAARAGLEDALDPQLAAMLRIEAGAACALDGAAPAPAPAAASTSVAAASTAPETAQPAATGKWSVQTGAFRQQATADALVERLQRAGFSPRQVRVPRNDLLRVRVGRFTHSGDASALLGRIRSQGFEAVVVSDADQEREP